MGSVAVENVPFLGNAACKSEDLPSVRANTHGILMLPRGRADRCYARFPFLQICFAPRAALFCSRSARPFYLPFLFLPRHLPRLPEFSWIHPAPRFQAESFS